MADHRADPRARHSADPTSSDPTRAVRRGRHAAARHAAPRRRRLSPAPTLVATAVAVTVGAAGSLWAGGPGPGAQAAADPVLTSAAGVQLPVQRVADLRPDLGMFPDRESEASRGSGRRTPATVAKLQRTVEKRARQRDEALTDLAAAAEEQAEEIEANTWVLPLGNYTITSGYGPRWGRMHAGIDLAAPTGTPLVAAASGTVTSVSYDSGYGNKTVLTLDDGTELWYCHQDSTVAPVGAELNAGDLIGYVGSTGNSTGPHLHLEIHPGGGDAVDPYPVLVSHGLQP